MTGETEAAPLSLAEAPAIVRAYYAEVMNRLPELFNEAGCVEIVVVSPGTKLPRTEAMRLEIIALWGAKDLNEDGVKLLCALITQEVERRIDEQQKWFECRVAWAPVIEACDLKYVDYSRSQLMVLWH